MFFLSILAMYRLKNDIFAHLIPTGGNASPQTAII